MKRLLTLMILAFVLAMGACAEKPVAVINGEKITRKMFDDFVAEKVGSHTGVVVNEVAIRNSAMEQLVAERLIIQGAKELKITVSDEELDSLVQEMKKGVGEEVFMKNLAAKGRTLEGLKRRVRENVVINRFVETLVPDTAVSEDDVKEYYKSSPTPFFKPAEVQVRFVETRTKEEALSILKDIEDRGGDFDAVVDEIRKEDPGRDKITVSSYGWANPDFFPPESAAALRKIEKGAYGGPFSGRSGYYLFKVKDRKEKSIKSFEEARAEVKAKLLDEKRQTAIGHWVFEKRKLSRVEINRT